MQKRVRLEQMEKYEFLAVIKYFYLKGLKVETHGTSALELGEGRGRILNS